MADKIDDVLSSWGAGRNALLYGPPATGKTRVRKVNIKSVQYRIARGSMMRMEKEDLDDPGLANAYRMTPKEFKARYAYLFETGEEQPAPAAKDAGEKKA